MNYRTEDILHECGDLWVSKINGRFAVMANNSTHAVGFIACDTLDQAIDNCEALSVRPDLVEKLCKR